MREVPGINEGNAYPSSYDRTHVASVVANYHLSKRWNLSSTWVYSTGNPTSYPVAKYDVQGTTYYYYSARNSNRIPDYHRLDISATYDFKKNDRKNNIEKATGNWPLAKKLGLKLPSIRFGLPTPVSRLRRMLPLTASRSGIAASIFGLRTPVFRLLTPVFDLPTSYSCCPLQLLRRHCGSKTERRKPELGWC